jgi:acyl carrier protein
MKQVILKAINEVLEGKGADMILDVEDKTDLRLDLGLDSFDLAELTVRIEEATGKDIFENGIVNTVGELRILLVK